MRATIGSLILLLVCSLQSFAQMGQFNYSSGYTLSDADNRPNWAAHNTWVAVPGAPTNPAWIAVGGNPGTDTTLPSPSTVLVGDSSGVVHQFTEPTGGTAGSWSVQSKYGNVWNVVAGANGVLYVPASDPNQCPSGYYVVYSWNSSNNSWDGPIGIAGGFGNGCFQSINSAADGTLVGANPSNAAGNSGWRWNGTGWDALPGGPYLECAAQNFNTIFCLTADQLSLYREPDNTKITTPGFKMNQIAVDAGGQMFIHRNDTQPALYRNSTGGTSPTWVGVAGGRVMTVATGGGNLIYGLAGGNVYHLSTLAEKVVGTMTGNGTCTGSCQITHDDFLQATFGGNNIGNTGSSHNGPYSDYANLTSTDYQYNPWDCYANNSFCMMSLTATVGCSATGGHDEGSGSVQAPFPCYVPPSPLDVWEHETVTVYFDANYFTIGPGTNQDYAWLGASSWSGLRTLSGVTYVNGGLIQPSQQCYDAIYQNYYPCNPSGSYIFMTKVGPGNWCSYTDAACTSHPKTDPSGHRGALVVFAPAIFNYPYPNHQIEHLAAHEEGHDNGLANCDGTFPCTAAGRTKTVMWSPFDGTDTYARIPTLCDALSANFARPF